MRERTRRHKQPRQMRRQKEESEERRRRRSGGMREEGEVDVETLQEEIKMPNGRKKR